MTHPKAKSKRAPKRNPRPGSDYGLVRRVAQKLGKSESLVSGVKRGVIPIRGPESQRIADALERERGAIAREQRMRSGESAA